MNREVLNPQSLEAGDFLQERSVVYLGNFVQFLDHLFEIFTNGPRPIIYVTWEQNNHPSNVFPETYS